MANDRKLNRREFVKGAALAGVGVVGAGAVAATTPTLALAEPAMNAEMYNQPWDFEIAPDPIAEADINETLEADVIVVGAGTSGLVTANSAADEGLKVIVVAASVMPVARGGSNNAIYSKAMAAAGLPKVDPWYIQKEIFANYNHVDQKKWYKYYNNSEEATNWMIDIMEGQGFYTALEQPNYVKSDSIYAQAVCSHSWVEGPDSVVVSQNQPEMVNHLARRLEGLGGAVFYQMRGIQLEREGGTSGRVTSLIAYDLVNGGYKRYTGTKAIVLAAGDFSGDRDMMTKYCPGYVSAVSEEVYNEDPLTMDYDKGLVPGGLYKGDMHKAALWIGAAWQKTIPNCVMIGTFSVGATENRYQNFFGLLVDRNGKRFMNEYASRSLGPITQSLQDGSMTYAIWDSDWVNHFEWYSANTAYQTRQMRTKEAVTAEWESSVERGAVIKADTIEELVQKADLPSSTVQTIQNYNAMCEAGADTEFYKNPDMMIPIKTGPFYCQSNNYSVVRFYTVLGGLRTNGDCQVCNENDEPLPGLYNVGTMVGDMFAGVYTFMIQGGNYGAACLTLGYVTGKFIAKNE